MKKEIVEYLGFEDDSKNPVEDQNLLIKRLRKNL